MSTPSRESFLRSMPAATMRSIWLIGMPYMRSITITLWLQ